MMGVSTYLFLEWGGSWFGWFDANVVIDRGYEVARA